MTDPSESADGSMQSVLVSWRGTGLEYARPGYLTPTTATARGFIVSFSLGDIAGGQVRTRDDVGVGGLVSGGTVGAAPEPTK